MTSTLGIKKIQYPNGTNIATLDSSGSIAFAGASTVAGTLGVTGAITGTLATAAQTNITSVGTLTSFRSTGIDDNADALAITIDNSERVGIGTASPIATLHTASGSSGRSWSNGVDRVIHEANATNIMQIVTSTTGTAGVNFADTDARAVSGVEYDHNAKSMAIAVNEGSGTIKFFNTSERMRIDASGTLLVGKANTTANVTGTEIEASGTIVSTRSGNTNIFLNRTSNDGNLIEFRKDNTTIGSIQSRAGAMLSIAFNPSGSDGAGFTGGSNAVLPANASALSDNAIDLGVGSYRYKDLYLSGGLRVGGTGTANTLDDYEEGTFNVLISTDSTYGGETQSGVYTKIGDICFFQIRFQRSGTLNSGVNARCSLPFTSANNGVQASGFRGSVENIDTSMVGIGGTIAANNTILYLNEMNAATTGYNVNGNDLGANFQIQIQGFYKTS